MARIDQLGEPEKAVVKVASVLGRRFRAGWIAGSYPAIGPADEVTRHLRAARSAPSHRHPGGRSRARVRLPPRHHPGGGVREPDPAHPRALHEGVSAYIEEAYADRLPQFVERLAYHYGRTRRTDKQRIWFRAAADAARAAFANEAAVDYYERLLDLMPEPEAGRVLLDLGSVWHLVGRWAEAEEAYRKAMSIAEAATNRSLLAASHRELGNLFMYTQSYAEAIDWLTLASTEFQLLDDPAGLARTLDRLAYALIQQGSYKEAAEVAQRHLAIASDAGDPAAVSAALDHIGLVCAYTGDQAGAQECLGRSLEMASAAGDRRGVIDAANNLGGFYATNGDHVNALECFQQALASAQEIGYRAGGRRGRQHR